MTGATVVTAAQKWNVSRNSLHPRRSLWRSAALCRVAASPPGDTEERNRPPLWSNHSDETFPLSSAPASGCGMCVGENSAAAPCQHVLVRVFYVCLHIEFSMTSSVWLSFSALLSVASALLAFSPAGQNRNLGTWRARQEAVWRDVRACRRVFLRGRECVNIPPPHPNCVRMCTVLCTSWAVCWCAAWRSSSQRSLLQGQQLCCRDVFKSPLCSAFYQCELDQLSSALG